LASHGSTRKNELAESKWQGDIVHGRTYAVRILCSDGETWQVEKETL